MLAPLWSLRCKKSSTPILPSLETFVKYEENTPRNTFENSQKPTISVNHGNSIRRRFQVFQKTQDRTILNDAKLNIAMLQACPMALFGSRYFLNQTITWDAYTLRRSSVGEAQLAQNVVRPCPSAYGPCVTFQASRIVVSLP